jgi:hypothetical protein
VRASWLLETDVFGEHLDRLVAEIKRQGMRVEIASYLGTHDSRTYLDLFDKDDCVVYYGSLNFAAQVQRQAPWVPGVYHNKPAYDCSRYYPALVKYDLLNSNYVMLPYGDIKRQKDFLLDEIGSCRCVFIRPCTGSKVFTGKLICDTHFDKDVDYLGYYGISDSEMCVIARPYLVEAEWRFVAAKGRIIAGSQYRADFKSDVKADYPQEAFALARCVAESEYDPDPVWCIDICRTKSRNYYLLEIGCFSCAGLYACDLEPIVREVSVTAVEKWQEVYDVDN